jgi:uncharacterized membrane protein YsdA (DUF1294 family)
VTVFLVYISLASLAAFVSFWRDKRAAESNERRVSEARLLTLAALGGTPGAKLGQALLRHKTRKQPFARNLNLILAMQIAAGVVVGVLWLRFAAL